MRVLFVSVNKSFRRDMALSELEQVAERAWPISLEKAEGCERLVAVFEGHAVGAWVVRGAYRTDETYETNGGERARIGLVLGDPVPLRPEFWEAPALRRGIAEVEV